MASPETMESVLQAAEKAWKKHLTKQKNSTKMDGMGAQPKQAVAEANQTVFSAHEAAMKIPARRKSQELFAAAFAHPQGSTQRLQAFKEYLKALRDEHAR
jgi:hypothetical protein